MSFQAFVFDLDGTLLDTLQDIADSANAVLEENELPAHSFEAYRAFIGDGVSELMSRALPFERRSPEMVTEYVNRFRQHYQRRWKNNTRLYPGIADALDEVDRRRLKMAILSNKPHDFTVKCVRELLSQWEFDMILGHRSDIPPKPSSEGALLIADSLQIDPSKTIFVGDSDNDMRTAVAAGMFPAGVLWGFRSADELRQSGARILISHPKELVSLLDSQPV